MSCESRARCLWVVVFSVLCSVALCLADSDDSQWEGYRNRLRPSALNPINQAFGWRMSQHARGARPGEIGGRIQRSLTRCRYSFGLEEEWTLENRIRARGKLMVTMDEGSSGALVGFFHNGSDGWRTPNSLAFRIDGNGNQYWVFFEYGTRHGRTGGKGCFEGERYQTTPTEPFTVNTTVHEWDLSYDPDLGEHGTLLLTLDAQRHALALTREAREDGAIFNRFGIWNQQTTGGALELWIDDLEVLGNEISFDEDPHWIGEQNRERYQPIGVRPFHDYGGGDGDDRIIGLIWRDEAPSYFGKRIDRKSLDDSLEASGRIRISQAAADSGFYLGWFDSKTKQTHGVPEHESRQKNYLGLLVEGPSRVGHYVRPGFGTETGAGRNLDSGPVIRPDNQWHQWVIRYDASSRELDVSLDGHWSRLRIREEELKTGASFDRFGVFNHQSGGWHLQFEIDRLKLSSGAN